MGWFFLSSNSLNSKCDVITNSESVYDFCFNALGVESETQIYVIYFAWLNKNNYGNIYKIKNNIHINNVLKSPQHVSSWTSSCQAGRHNTPFLILCIERKNSAV